MKTAEAEIEKRRFFVWDSESKGVLKCILIYKILFWMVASGILLLDEDENYNAFFHENLHKYHPFTWPLAGEISRASRLATWDPGHYLTLATIWATGKNEMEVPTFDGKIAIAKAYQDESPRCALYPLWPMFLTPAAWIGGAKLAFTFGLVLSNVLSVFALWILYGHLREQGNHATALLTILMIISMTGAIFLSLIYTESLFLFLAVTSLRALSLRRYKVFAITSFLLPLTKAIGFFILIAAGVHWLRITFFKHIKSDVEKDENAIRKLCNLIMNLMIMMMPALCGYACYFWFMWATTGNALEGFDAQQYFANRPSVSQIFHIDEFAKAFIKVEDIFHPIGGLMDRLCFICFIFGASLYATNLRKGFRYEDFCWVLAIGIIPALSNQLLSYTRFLMMCFPVFFGIATELNYMKQRWLIICILLILLMFQAQALLRYLRYDWVS